ncbi:hypothetical protein FOA52_013399 [Chlamydomonas sp. UWO 241]|nr:hypothetical protein FOA52_013399 [Chlamydomonas sp. UWO 241]
MAAATVAAVAADAGAGGEAQGREEEHAQKIVGLKYRSIKVHLAVPALASSTALSSGRADVGLEYRALKIAILREAMTIGPFARDAATAAAHLVQGGEISSPGEMLEDVYLRRWLRARGWDVDVAARCIVSHAEWRVQMMPKGGIAAVRGSHTHAHTHTCPRVHACMMSNSSSSSIVSHAEWRVQMMAKGGIAAADVANELASEKAFLLGTDRQGRAVLLIQAKKHGAWTRKLGELERCLLDMAHNGKPPH